MVSFRALAVLLINTADATASWPLSCPSDMTATELLGDLDLSGKVFVITGADSNIGQAVTSALAARNATMVMACLHPRLCQAVGTSVFSKVRTGRFETLYVDLSSMSAMRNFAIELQSRHSRVDALINSASGHESVALTKDGFINSAEIMMLGPAYLAQLLMPSLRVSPEHPIPGRVVNVISETMGGTDFLDNATVDGITSWVTKMDPNFSPQSYLAPKILLLHNTIELARREKDIVAFSVDPGYAPKITPFEIEHATPQQRQRIETICATNFKGLRKCPETADNSAAVIVAAAAMPGIEAWSGSYLDFDAREAPSSYIFGGYELHEPNCVPRAPPPMDAGLRRAWYDRMMALLRHGEQSLELRNSSLLTVFV